jgi:hypothetical protein
MMSFERSLAGHKICRRPGLDPGPRFLTVLQKKSGIPGRARDDEVGAESAKISAVRVLNKMT